MINIRFLVQGECDTWYWNNVPHIPRVGDTIENYGRVYKVKEVTWTAWNNLKILLISND